MGVGAWLLSMLDDQVPRWAARSSTEAIAKWLPVASNIEKAFVDELRSIIYGMCGRRMRTAIYCPQPQAAATPLLLCSIPGRILSSSIEGRDSLHDLYLPKVLT